MDQNEGPVSESSWDLTAAVKRVHAFNEARGWQAYHNPKNLVMALSGEVGELTAHFQWLTSAEASAAPTATNFTEVRDEVADVAIYFVSLVDRLGIDLPTAIIEKLTRNEQRFPSLLPAEESK